MPLSLALVVLGAYVALLFVLAAWGDAHAARFDRSARRRAILYTLALAVYCTSWTFYGAVGEAARAGWDYLPIYLGPALVFLLGFPIIRRLVALGGLAWHAVVGCAQPPGPRNGPTWVPWCTWLIHIDVASSQVAPVACARRHPGAKRHGAMFRTPNQAAR